jgi:hypothetical protein
LRQQGAVSSGSRAPWRKARCGTRRPILRQRRQSSRAGVCRDRAPRRPDRGF